MSRQNRVLPTGDIVAAPFRGAWTGNRGVLHRPDGTLGRARWRSKAWICCRLDWKGRRRAIMAPGRWTELFFFDEAVALAAGHRPCAECRRADFERFRDAWRIATGADAAPRAPVMDAGLHAARVDPMTGGQVTFQATIRSLPDGVFIRVSADRPALLRAGRLHPYLGDGYGAGMEAPPDALVTVLTPAPTVAAIAAGYAPAA